MNVLLPRLGKAALYWECWCCLRRKKTSDGPTRTSRQRVLRTLQEDFVSNDGQCPQSAPRLEDCCFVYFLSSGTCWAFNYGCGFNYVDKLEKETKRIIQPSKRLTFTCCLMKHTISSQSHFTAKLCRWKQICRKSRRVDKLCCASTFFFVSDSTTRQLKCKNAVSAENQTHIREMIALSVTAFSLDMEFVTAEDADAIMTVMLTCLHAVKCTIAR